MSDAGLLADLLTRRQMAAELHCNERTIARREAEPDGLPSMTWAGRKYYRIESVREWLARREQWPNPTQTRRKRS